MLHVPRLVEEFFWRLEKIDEEISARVAAAGCPHCEGPLHRGDYHRKPRGGLIGVLGEAFTRRHSLCCGRRGCRKRSLPPSLRFLGRRVYLEAVVVLGSVLAQVMATLREASRASGVPGRTLRRWGSWWRREFPRLPIWAELRAWLVPPPVNETDLPRSLLTRIESDLCASAGHREAVAFDEVMVLGARCLAPMTTGSVVDGSRFVRAVFVSTAPATAM